jgi:UDP-N-acetylglucosamine--N-acetylmuramyl-(pentapeptide) pyrophosphoryl-undecaprenol N-acetylglucosamine transferase
VARPIVIAGGGTGGHLFPMVAIAEALQRAGVQREDLRFVAARRGPDRRILAPTGVPATYLSGRGIARSVAPRAVLQNLGATLGLAAAALIAVVKFAAWRPRAVVSVGGYAAVAAGVAARVTRSPLVLVELDARPLASHRLAQRSAVRRCVAFASDDPREVVTGAPLRDSIETLVRLPLAARHVDGTSWRIVVMTGSLGARSVNRAVVALASAWRDRDDLDITHVTGERDAALCAAAWTPRSTDRLSYRQVAFVDMATLWPTCDLAVTRAGAMTLAELARLAIPAVLVPLPGAPGDHQGHNARDVAATGAAVVIADADLTVSSLGDALDATVRVDVLGPMEDAMGARGRAGAADAIAREVVAVARG